ncbi:MAG: extracellular catalytic domain type 1 short-chain-length polyhydroxyalkanoate depolymerase [Pseudobdellovibrionaceae bacterium]
MKNSIIFKTLSLISFMLGSFQIRSLATEKLFIPSHAQPQAPLVVALHGCLRKVEDVEKITRMSELGEKYGFYVLYPEPSLSTSKGCFNFYSEESQKPGGGDAALVVKRVQDLLNTYDIDRTKVYVLGMSGGASLVSVLTSCYPTVFNGAAIHSGMGYGLASTWQESLFIAKNGPSIWHQRNTACTPSNYQGKMFLIHGSHDQVMNPLHFSLLKEDYFSGTESTTEEIPPKLGYYGYTHQTFYQNNKIKGHGILVQGMNHEWSGTNTINPMAPLGPDASSLIIDFFLN